MIHARKRWKKYSVAALLALTGGETEAFHVRPGLSEASVYHVGISHRIAAKRCPIAKGCQPLRSFERDHMDFQGDVSTSSALPKKADASGTISRGSAQAVNGAVVAHKHDHITNVDKLVVALSTASIALIFAGVVSVSGPGAWRYYLAGGICAAVSHAITTPIDVVKTRQQVDPELKEKGIVKSTVKIIKKDGIRTLLAGLGPTTWGYLFEGAVKFGIYEVLKPAVRRALAWSSAVTSVHSLNSKVLCFVLCGSMAGVAASAMLCPMEALRIRLVAEPDFAPGGWVQGGMKMLKYEGVGGLWKGMSAMMCKQVPYTVTKNVSFDFFTTLAYSSMITAGYVMTAKMKLAIPLLSAMAASVLSCISSQPGDMLLSAVNAHEGHKRVRDFTKDILKEDGFGGFFRGIQARFLHVGLIVTVQLLIYDFIKRLCGVAATGSV